MDLRNLAMLDVATISVPCISTVELVVLSLRDVVAVHSSQLPSISGCMESTDASMACTVETRTSSILCSGLVPEDGL